MMIPLDYYDRDIQHVAEFTSTHHKHIQCMLKNRKWALMPVIAILLLLIIQCTEIKAFYKEDVFYNMA
jgi:hypothetical protein